MACWQNVETSRIAKVCCARLNSIPTDEICLQGFDDITGDYINPELIQQARQEEMNGFRDMEVYEYVSGEEALSDPTGTVVGVRWADHNKATPLRPEVRSRLVAQEFASKDRRDDLFAATPSSAATRLLLAGLACSCNRESDRRTRSCSSM